MDLTTLHVRNARRCIADVEAADITNPDMPQRTAVRLITRVMETLRTMADHTERLQIHVDELSASKASLQREVLRLQRVLADREESKPETEAV